MIFEGTQKNLSFTYMATLTKYNTFKSLKQNSSEKIKKTVNPQKKVEAEIEAFLHMLSKTKTKKA